MQTAARTSQVAAAADFTMDGEERKNVVPQVSCLLYRRVRG
jgi:hypothetical protein